DQGLSANEIAPALIPMMARSETLQSKAGYIDARPLPLYRRNSLAPHGRTIHLGHSLPGRASGKSGHVRYAAECGSNFTIKRWGFLVPSGILQTALERPILSGPTQVAKIQKSPSLLDPYSTEGRFSSSYH